MAKMLTDAQANHFFKQNWLAPMRDVDSLTYVALCAASRQYRDGEVKQIADV
jgi:hypothetical protein